jgi:hypothetical protein
MIALAHEHVVDEPPEGLALAAVTSANHDSAEPAPRRGREVRTRGTVPPP